MKIGICSFVADGAIDAVSLGTAVEERGFESLFLGEHTHMPTTVPFRQAGGLPDYYFTCFDPYLALTAVAVATTSLRLGTGISLVVQRDPITLAKEIATLDAISGGRFLFGIGTGWSVVEMQNHGTDPATRASLMRDRVLAMKEIWTHDEAEYHGRFVDFGPMRSWPKPVQQPHPPVLVGGSGPKVLDRVVDYGDGWMPMAWTLDVLLEGMPALEEKAAAAGRNPIPVTATAAPPTTEILEKCVEAGVDRILYHVDCLPKDDTLRALDSLRAFVDSAGSLVAS